MHTVIRFSRRCSVSDPSKRTGDIVSKLDLESIYRIIPVHPQDRHLLGMQFDGKLYVDVVLPFGLRSALLSTC